MIISAACTSGMGRFSPCVFYPKNQRVAAGARKAPWFHDLCRRKGRDVLRSLRDGREDLQNTKKEYRKHTRRVACKFAKQQTAFLGQVEQMGSSYLRHAETKKDNLSIPCAYRCLDYLPSFTFPKPPDTLNRNSRHIDARASAVPLGRGRISQGMNRTVDAFDCPSFAVMTCLVSKFLGKMNASSSPGFEEFNVGLLIQMSLRFLIYLCWKA